MASATSKIPCATCGKGVGLFKCEGCTKTFCTKHVVEHRQTLSQQLDEIAIEHDVLQETIKHSNDQNNSLSNCIDEWEQKSIEKIQKMAKEMRGKLVEVSNIHRGKISEKLNHITQQIKKAREEDDFFETDLKNWIITLNQLQHELSKGSLSSNITEDQSVPLVYSLKLITTSEVNNKTTFKHPQTKSKVNHCEEIFEKCLDGARIEDNGRLIIHDKPNRSVEVRGKYDYSSGIHRFRLLIEKNPLGTWIFFGVITKSAPMKHNSYDSSSSYGWADFNDIFIDGIRQNNQTSGQFSQTQEHDIISIVFDCDNQKISYTNENNQHTQDLKIDISKCPFPWKLHVNLFGTDDQVRLLTGSDTSRIVSYFDQ